MAIGVLIEINDSAESRTYYLDAGLVKIGRGRSSNCEIQLDHEGVSREHATIERRENGYLIQDTQSHNGTYVNDVSIIRRVLRDGDQVRLGNARFTFHEIEDPPERGRHREPGQGLATVKTRSPSATETLATSDLDTIDHRDSSVGVAGDSWQIIQRFAAEDARNLEDILAKFADELGSLPGISLCELFLGSWSVIGYSINLRSSGSQRGRCSKITQADLERVAREAGHCSYPDCGNLSELTEVGVEALALPIRIRSHPAGYLYAQSHDILDDRALTVLQNTAHALGVGISIWNLGRVIMQTAVAAGRQPEGIIGKSEHLHTSLALAEKAARATTTVLLTGETGTGKELFARLIHDESQRRLEKFLAVNCSLFHGQLLDDALFGHERGAFTGAVGVKRGYFEAVNHGTIFLDEIGELSLEVQAKLLRVLQEGEIVRVGSNEPVSVDVRVIAATHRNLFDMTEQGQFREDLFYRLNVIEIKLPPLRERREDIPDLVRHFIGEFREQVRTSIRDISRDALEVLTEHAWPGNIRELRNIVERAIVLADGPEITPTDLPPDLPTRRHHGREPVESSTADQTLEAVEFQHIRRVVDHCSGQKSRAAKMLGISRTTLNDKLKRMGSGGSPASPFSGESA